MDRRLIACALTGLLALSAPRWVRADEPGTVKPEDVKSWTMKIDDQEYSVRPATPSYAGDTGLFRLSTAYTLPKGKVAFSLFRDNYDRDPKDIDFSVHGLNLAYGATHKLELFGAVGLQNRINTDAASQAGFANDYPFAGNSTLSYPRWQTGFGDIKIGAKYNILDDYSNDAVGLAIRGFVKLPTADEMKGLGTGKVSAGADLVLSKHLNRSADLHASLGYQMNSDPDNANIGNAFKWGVGLNVPACRIFQLQAELVGTQYGEAAFDQNNPMDLVVGAVLWIKPGLFIRPAISWNLNFDDRGLNSASRTFTGRQISIGYHPGTKCCKVAVPPPPPPVVQNRPPTVGCDIDRSNILPGETVRCRATGSDPDGDPLTYSWSANMGSVRGTGAEAIFDSAGIQGPGTATITVRVSDGRGGTAEARCVVSIAAPKPTDVVRCISGGFPRNLARLNNVDKACLDDVVARLKADPRSRVVIIGHADKGERYPLVMGRKRAEAVKAYLVQQGVEESRISVRSAAADRPADMGKTAMARAKNRRVEVIYIPEGALAPEDAK
jgi:outer membrane protein OmpA-like peptidoglycan-associated protein